MVGVAHFLNEDDLERLLYLTKDSNDTLGAELLERRLNIAPQYVGVQRAACGWDHFVSTGDDMLLSRSRTFSNETLRYERKESRKWHG